jgi:hypothetical protein
MKETPMRRQNSTLCCAALALFVLGCGDDDSGENMDPVSGGGAGAASGAGGDGTAGGAAGASAGGRSGGGAGAGAAGASAAGASGAGGSGVMAGAGGGGGAAGADAPVSGAHCSPGTVYSVRGGGPSVIAVETLCDSRDVDGDSEEDHLEGIALPEPMRAGERYAFSATFETGWIDAELWGTDSSCGEPLELLASGRVEADAITCFTMNPTMAHSHLLWVWTFGGGSVREFAICPTGTCEH